MSVTNVSDLTNIGQIADSDKLVGERVDGTTVRIEFTGVLQDGEFSSNGLMTRTAAGTYANRTVTGTASRISITDGDGVSGNPTIDIDSSYVGQTSITTLGTITTGTWQGTTIAVDQGGTGQTSYTDGQLLIGNSTGNTLAKATLTEGAGIDITNGSGTITIAAETATDTNAGIAELATTAEVTTGTDTGRVIPVSALPSQIQDSKYVYAADGEASDTYVITLTPAPAAYAEGQVFHFKANTANTGAATLNVNSLGAANILKHNDQTLDTGDIEAGQIVTVVYDGTQFQMQSQRGNISLDVGLTQTNTGAKTFNDSTLLLAGSSSGTTTVNASATASGTLTLPAATDTLVGRATTDTLTNKTFDANGTGNSLSNVDVADLANGTDGELITWDASGNPATVAVGTSTHVLTSNGAGAAPTFQVIPTATQADQETGTSTTVFVTPGRQHFHDSAAKAWAKVAVSGGTPSISESYNMASITDNGVGLYQLDFTTDLSTSNYGVSGGLNRSNATATGMINFYGQNVGDFDIATRDSSATLIDPVAFFVSCHGDI